MTIGILLQYRDDDDTHMGLSTASVLEQLGFSVSVATCLPKVHRTHPDWDDRCETGVRLCSSDKWSEDKEVIICTHTYPHLYNKKIKDRKVIRILQCDALGEFYKKPGRPKADVFVCPSAKFTGTISTRMKVDNVAHIPWCMGIPPTVKAKPVDGPPRLLIPLYGDNARRSNPDILSVIDSILSDKKVKCSVTIAYSRTSAPFARKIVTSIAKSSDKLKLAYNLTWEERLQAYANHDLTVLPFVIDGTGMSTSCSLSMGTPCFGLSIAPINEYARNDVNSLLLTTKTKIDKMGMEVAAPDYRIFEKRLKALIADRTRINELASRTAVDMSELPSRFEEAWKIILGINV